MARVQGTCFLLMSAIGPGSAGLCECLERVSPVDVCNQTIERVRAMGAKERDSVREECDDGGGRAALEAVSI
jgi:hypothetical protein